MLKSLLDTRQDWTTLALRVTLGAVMFPHGAQKLFGWFGGSGLSGTLAFFEEAFGIPAALTVLVIGFEFFGSIALILGAFSRVAAAGIAVIMIVAILKVHAANGLFMNWFGNQPGEGFEYHLLALAAVVVLKGSGALSLDRKLVTATA